MEIDLGACSGAALAPDALRAQVCVIGGGIAGLVLADQLVSTGVSVLVLEAGGRGAPATSSEVELAGEPHLGSREGRPQGLGGSAAVWGGQLLPPLPGGKWPVSDSEVQPFFGGIERLLGVDDLPYEGDRFLKRQRREDSSTSMGKPLLATRLSKFAPFGMRNLANSVGARLLASTRGRVLLHARAVTLRLDGARVVAVEARAPNGEALRIEAEQVVVAAGTVESCRLLLASARAAEAGAAAAWQDRVGRGFHDHLTVEIAEFTGVDRERAVELFRPWMVGGLRGTAHGYKLEAGEELRRRLGLNFALAHVTFREEESSGVAALRAMMQARQRGAAPPKVNWAALPGALHDSWRLQRAATVQRRRWISPKARVGLRINVAQKVGASCRVELAERVDALEQPLARVHWEIEPEDLRTLHGFAGYLRAEFGRNGFHHTRWHSGIPPLPDEGTPGDGVMEGRLLEGVEDARHAMGGACMGTDPRTSVVDADLRVHGVDNLYVASAAVLPDGRAQLPTLMLMALSLRLAERLRAAAGRNRA